MTIKPPDEKSTGGLLLKGIHKFLQLFSNHTVTVVIKVQTVCWRLLLRHTQWCEGLAEAFIEKCKGNNEEANQLFDRFVKEFGQHDFELERYFDFGLAVKSFENILKKRPKIEL